MAARGQHAAVNSTQSQTNLESYSRSLRQFCNFVEYCSQEVDDPERIVDMCEAHAETVRLTAQDVTMESIDMLLNTMLNTLYNMSEVQEQKRWSNRLKGAFFGRGKTRQHPQQAMAFQNM
jgi:hypothetical protein